MGGSARRDLVANYLGRGVSVLSGLLVLPFYRELLGPERFGVVAFFTMIQSLLATLDAGLGAAFLQRISRTLGDEAARTELPDVAATFATMAAALAAATLALVGAAAPVVPRALRVGEMLAADTRLSSLIMALVLASWWPSTFFQGALLHLGRQPESNITSAGFAVLRALATYSTLRWGSTSLVGYAAPQAIVGVAQSLVLFWRVRAALPEARLGTPRRRMVREELPNALALGAASMLGIIITNTDRAAITALRPVAELGTYGFAALAMTASAQVIAPIHATYYPRLCELSDPEGRERVYLEAHSVAVALAWPVTLSLAAYAPTVLRLWTRDGSIEAAAGLPLSILSLAASVNAPLQVVLGLAYAMQRAPDVARMQTLGAIGFAIACPALVWRWGIGGAALATLGFNLTLAAIFVTRTHRALRGSGTTRRWLRTILPIAMPVAAIATVGAGLSWTTPSLAARAVIAGLGSVAAALAGVGMLRRLRAAQASR